MITGQKKKCTEATRSKLGEDTRRVSTDVLHQFAASLDIESLEDPSAEKVKQLCSTYSNAVDWMNKYRPTSDILVALRLLQIYPKLIESDSTSPLLKLLKPLLKLPQPSVEAEDETEPVTSRKTVYVCGLSEYICEGVTAKDRIIASLSCYCRVQTHPDPPPQEDNAEDALEEIKTSDVFIFLLNDDTLNCWFSLYRLAGAITYSIPIITIRDSSFELSDPLPESFYQTEIRTGPHLGLSLDIANGHVSRESRLPSSRSSGFHSACSQIKYTESIDQFSSDCCLLADVIKTCHLSSMKYVPKFHDSCIAKLFGKLSDYLGDFFLDLEISNSHFGRVTPDAEAENDKASVYFSKSAILRKRSTPPLRRATDLTITGNENSQTSTPYSENTSSSKSGYKMAKLMSRDDPFADDNDCESPFVHRTNYVVFPSRSPSSSRKSPYIVAFPEGIDTVEKEDNDQLVSPYGDFDNVQLDLTIPLTDNDSPQQPLTTSDKTNKEAEHVKAASKKRLKDFKTSRDQTLQRREPTQCTVVRDNAGLPTNRKKMGRRTAKLPKINLEVHDARMMKNHDKAKRLGKSFSL